MMTSDTVLASVGNLTADPDLRFTPAGAAVATFTVASTPRTYDRQQGEWKDGQALFMRCGEPSSNSTSGEVGPSLRCTGANLNPNSASRHRNASTDSADLDWEAEIPPPVEEPAPF